MPPANRDLLGLVLFWVVVTGLCFAGLGRGLWTPDEPREAEIAREMYLSPGFLPHLNGKSFFEKPPLYYWATAAAYALTGGPSEAAARAVSGLAGLLTLVVVYRWARRHASQGAALMAVFMLATSLQFFQSTHWVLLDPLLMLFVVLALWAAFERLSGGRWPCLALFYGAIVLAIWTKGPVGLALPAAGLAAYVLWMRRPALLLAFRPLSGALLILLALAGMLWAFYAVEGREALHELVRVNQVQRFVHPQTTGHNQPFFYYLQALPLAVMPWIVPLLLVFAPSFWKARPDGEAADLRVFLGSVVAGSLLLLGAASTKRETYLLPILPPLMILLALALWDAVGAAGGREGRYVRTLTRFVQPVVLCLWGLAVPMGLLIYTRSPWPRYFLAAALALLAGAAGVLWGRRGSLARAWEGQRVSALLFCLAVLVLAVPVLEVQKDMTPFLRWMDGEMPKGVPVAALGADETLCGIIPFATGRAVEPLTGDQFKTLAKGPRRPPYIAQQGDSRFPADAAPDAEGYVLLREGRFGPNRYIRLWRDRHADVSEERTQP